MWARVHTFDPRPPQAGDHHEHLHHTHAITAPLVAFYEDEIITAVYKHRAGRPYIIASPLPPLMDHCLK